MQERTLGYRRILNRRRIIVRVLSLNRLLPGMFIFAAEMSIRIVTTLKLNGPVFIFIINHDTDLHRLDGMLNKRRTEVVPEIAGEAGSGRVGQLLAGLSQSKKAELTLKF